MKVNAQVFSVLSKKKNRVGKVIKFLIFLQPPDTWRVQKCSILNNTVIIFESLLMSPTD